MQAKLFMALEFLEEKGPLLREPYSKSLGDGIFEVRAKQGSDISRVLYFFVVGQTEHPDQRFCKENCRKPQQMKLNAQNVIAKIIRPGRRANHGKEFS